ncbi:MAG: hypothetical protein WBE78_13350, partial [Candidatus Binataceae bacterium]
MTTNEAFPGLNGLIREIVKNPRPRRTEPIAQDVEKYFRSFAALDYAAALDKHFDRWEFREILTEMRAALPMLNREVFAVLDQRRLAQIAAELGAVLHANPFEGCEGRSLRGFYVHNSDLVDRPLIGLNTANHPVAVAATFWHEIGHHLTSRIFDDSNALELTFNTNYESHLSDPREITADMLMVVACYPRSAATRLFGRPRTAARGNDPQALITRVRPYLLSVTGFDFKKDSAPAENLLYLAGMIHIAK